ncbi:allose kinase [Youxingia wuxianensis]|uniref:Allose kinase n=1 Tax=Youxingia wuxianensis TaxID=2763678 RepID=A0A926ERT2_9FIRM|nr:allose kinase [Youxingia wuxianensis]MBC8586277.1 allose kinase [Youxingia wuxianensis]
MDGDKIILGMDIGGTNMRFGLIDKDCRLSAFTIKKTRLILDCSDPVLTLAGCVKDYCREHLGSRLPDAVALGFPSAIDRSRRIVCSTPNIKGLGDNLPVADIMERELGVPTYINRDVNFLLFYDTYFHGLPSHATVLGFYVGTGFGNAVSVDGKLLLGKNGVAAELGHIPVLGKDTPCGCGNRGCVEYYASGLGLERIQAHSFPHTPVGRLFKEHGDALELLEYIDWLSIPIATEINIFDPDYIVLGGGVLQMEAFPQKLLEKRILEHTRKPYPAANLSVLYSSPHQENGVIGAGIYALRRLADPSYC